MWRAARGLLPPAGGRAARGLLHSGGGRPALERSFRRKRMPALLKVMRTILAGAALVAVLAPSAFAQMELKIMAPAAPGGGWDQTARSMQQALVAEKIARSVQGN